MSPSGPSAVRIASLVPSLTELVAALGLGENLVARTGWCIHPAEVVARVAKVGGTKTVNLAKLRRLAPTHVLVNVDENRRETIEAIRAWGDAAPEIVVTHPLGPEDNPALVARLAALFGALPGVGERAEALGAELRRELDLTTPAGRPELSVLYLIWHDPWMTVARDTYLSRMLARVGWLTLPAHDGGAAGAARYPALAGDEPWLGRVERVLLSSEPFAFEAHHVEAAQALCPQARVERVDGELLSWYGARAVAGLAYLRALADDNRGPAGADA
ncbi:MAG: helical backbone metal receptor [Caldimonas sp.]